MLEYFFATAGIWPALDIAGQFRQPALNSDQNWPNLRSKPIFIVPLSDFEVHGQIFNFFICAPHGASNRTGAVIAAISI